MTLLLAEGFEFFHPSSKNLSKDGGHFGPKYATWRGGLDMDLASKEMIFEDPGPSSDPYYPEGATDDTPNVKIERGMVDEHIEKGRKGGRSVSIYATSSGSSFGYAGLGFKVEKSRTLYVGFALRLEYLGQTFDPYVIVSFGRSNFRGPLQDTGNYENVMTPVGGCCFMDRGQYADLVWKFNGMEEPWVNQLTHGRNFRKGDWHFMEFGTTVYGNEPEEHESIAWGEARIAGISDRASNIRTAMPNTEDDTFIDTVTIRVLCPHINPYSFVGADPEDLYRFRVVIDDVYICNDQGEVNNDFMGGIYVRPAWPTHQAMLQHAYSVAEVYKHKAVGPSFVGDEQELPAEPPAPEEDQWWEPWEYPDKSHIVLPRRGNRQNFVTSAVDFAGSQPHIRAVTADLLTKIPNKNIARGVLTPIKTTGGTSHSYFPVSADMLRHTPSITQLVCNNPNAGGERHEQASQWKDSGVTNADIGFRLDQVEDQYAFEEKWNPALLRWPLVHHQIVDEDLGFVEWVGRYWEELIPDGIDLAPFSDRAWACFAYDEFPIKDIAERLRVTELFAWSHLWNTSELVVPSEFVQDGFEMGDSNKFDYVLRVEEDLTVYDLGYHEHVELLTSWLDPYDFSDRAWSQKVQDELKLEITDIFDNHFKVKDSFVPLDVTWTNHFLAEDFFGFDQELFSGWVHRFTLETIIDLHADHHDGWWVEHFNVPLEFEEEILTRHWRFYIVAFAGVVFVCRWYQIGSVEQPLEWWEPNPCDVIKGTIHQESRDEYLDLVIGPYEDYIIDQWIELGGDPAVIEDREYIRWNDYSEFIYEEDPNNPGHLIVVDIIDENGNSIMDMEDIYMEE